MQSRHIIAERFTYHFVIAVWRAKKGRIHRVKYWEIIADNVHKARWSLGWVSALDVEERTIWIADGHGDGKRFIVRAEKIPTAFEELQRAIREFAVVFDDFTYENRRGREWSRREASEIDEARRVS